jgi:hypothetical protein
MKSELGADMSVASANDGMLCCTFTGTWTGTYTFGPLSADLVQAGGSVTGSITDAAACVWDVTGSAAGDQLSLPSWTLRVAASPICVGGTVSLAGTLDPSGTTISGTGSTTLSGGGTFPWTFVLQRTDDGVQLPVARLSQDDPTWAANIYDSSSWTIGQKGCALTALSMALSFAGMSTDPGTLNTFMTNTDMNFAGSAVNWGPTVRDWSNNTLRYQALSANTPAQLQSALRAGVPVVVGVDVVGGMPRHFVLVTGFSGTQFHIADPGYASRTTLDAYQNQFQVRGAVVPVGFVGPLLNAGGPASGGVDLQEVVLAIKNARIMIVDSQGRRTGFDPATGIAREEIPGTHYWEDALKDDVSEAPPSEFSSFIQANNLSAGQYTVVVSGTVSGLHLMSVRSFDGLTAHPALVVPVVTSATSRTEFSVTVAADAAPIVTRLATFEQAIAEIELLASSGMITTDGMRTSIHQKLSQAQAAALRGNIATARSILTALSSQLKSVPEQQITQLGVQVLLAMLDSLLSALG